MQELLARREMIGEVPLREGFEVKQAGNDSTEPAAFAEGTGPGGGGRSGEGHQESDDDSTHLAPKLRGIVDGTKKEVVLVSPYFVPGKEGTEWFARLRHAEWRSH